MRLFKKNQSKTIRIVPNQDFLDGAVRYEKGQVYEVELGLARYFERNGWLEGTDIRPTAASKLAIDNSVLGHDGGF